MVDDGWTTDGRMMDGWTDHGHPISSPCEPNRSGELKNRFNIPITSHLQAFLAKMKQKS